jgi:hypothetical protein
LVRASLFFLSSMRCGVPAHQPMRGQYIQHIGRVVHSLLLCFKQANGACGSVVGWGHYAASRKVVG